jgi:hypothetical protein
MPDYEQPAAYQIVVYGQLNERWSDWFNGMAIVHKASEEKIPTTILTGQIADQAALRGLLVKVWDLGLVLISVKRIAHE